MQLLPWKFQCLFQILVDLSETQILNQMVEEIFFFPLNKCPDLLILGLLECTGNNTRLKEVVLIKAILKFLYPTSAHPNSTQIFQRIWPNDFNHTHVNSLTWSQRLLLTSMIELYSSSTPEEQQQKLSRILDLSQDLKALNLLLSSNSYLFVIDLACLASRREYLKLDKWLNDKIQTNGQPFIEVCVTFLKRRCPAFGPNESSTMTFPNETFTTILNCLRQYISDNPKTLAELELVKMLTKYSQWIQQAPVTPNPLRPSQFDGNILGMQSFTDNQLLNQIRATNSNPANVVNTQGFFPDIEQEFSKDIEEEADSYFTKIYNQDLPDCMSIDQVLDMLKKFQESPNKREKEVFACMIRNLFKEYPFLFQYPDKELETTGEIFGGIILYDFVKGYSFVGALRYVLESLKKPINSQYFTFGKAALNKFKSRLKEFPQFCQHLINIPHFREFPPLLAEYIEYGKQSQEPPIAVSSNGAAFGNAFNVKKMSTNSNPTMPVMPFINKSVNSGNDTPMNIVPEIVPPNAFQDKIAFIINNLSLLNLNKKTEEFKDLLAKEKEQYNGWISQYIVMKRVSLEANFHELYANFVAKLAMSDLCKLILNETYRNIKVLLRSNKETDNFNDRTLLKNLGQWLGLITIGQNKPVLTIDLDLKSLLIEAYHKGLQQLLYVVPFVAKVIAGCAKSRVFRPPNPWTDALIFILVELHSEEDLKLNLKFEVEVLLKNLELDMADYVGKSTILKNKELFSKIEPQLSLSLPPPPVAQMVPSSVPTPDSVMASLAPQSPASSIDMVNIVHQDNTPSLLVPQVTANLHNYNEINISNIAQFNRSISIQPNLQVIMLNPSLTGIIKKLIEKDVQEWILYISDRVINVPIVTTETLIKKDFAKEPNPELMKIAAQSMLKCLIAGFSLINTKESLSNRIHQSMIPLLQSKCKNISKEIIDSTASTLINDNIDLCVCFVQKTCIERGLEEMEKKMKADFEAGVYGNDLHKLKGGTITLKQMAVYEEMGRNIPGFFAQTGPLPNSTLIHLENLKNNVAAPPNIPNYSALPNDVVLPMQQQPPQQQLQETPPVMDSFAPIYDKLIGQLHELIQEFEYVNNNTDTMHQVLKVLQLSKKNSRDQNTAMTLISNVITAFRELLIIADNGTSDFAVISRIRDFYLILLKALTDQRAFNVRFTTTNITRFVMDHWIRMNQVFPDELFDTLSRASLINFAYMDNEFFQFLENGHNTAAISIILNFLKWYLNAGYTSNFFANTLELLQRIALKVNQSNHPLLTDLKNILTLAQRNLNQSAVTNNNVEPIVDSALLVEKAELIIKDWINNFNSPKNTINNSFTFMVKNMNAQVNFLFIVCCLFLTLF